MTFNSAVCFKSSWFVVLSQPLRCRCPGCCVFARGYSTGFEQWYRRFCGICISFPQRPVGQPGAVYLSGYKAASQRAKGKGNETEVGVKGQDVIVCSNRAVRYARVWDTAEGGFGSQRAVCDSWMPLCRYTCTSVSIHTSVQYVHILLRTANMNANNFALEHFASTLSA